MNRLEALEAVVEAAKHVRDGWTGQHEIGEAWRGEIEDINALREALAAYDKSEGV